MRFCAIQKRMCSHTGKANFLHFCPQIVHNDVRSAQSCKDSTGNVTLRRQSSCRQRDKRRDYILVRTTLSTDKKMTEFFSKLLFPFYDDRYVTGSCHKHGPRGNAEISTSASPLPGTCSKIPPPPPILTPSCQMLFQACSSFLNVL